MAKGRNVANVEDIESFVGSFDTENDKVDKWLSTTLRKWLIRNGTGKLVRNGHGRQKWVKEALKRGEEVIDVTIIESLEFRDQISSTVDYLIHFTRDNPSSDLQRISYDQAVSQSEEYHVKIAMAATHKKKGVTKGGKVKLIYGFESGYQWQRLLDYEALEIEHVEMGHCVDTYWPRVERGTSRIYSLRDGGGVPHITLEVRRSDDSKVEEGEINRPYINQIKGHSNKEVKEKYLKYLAWFVVNVGGDWGIRTSLPPKIRAEVAAEKMRRFESLGDGTVEVIYRYKEDRLFRSLGYDSRKKAMLLAEIMGGGGFIDSYYSHGEIFVAKVGGNWECVLLIKNKKVRIVSIKRDLSTISKIFIAKLLNDRECEKIYGLHFLSDTRFLGRIILKGIADRRLSAFTDPYSSVKFRMTADAYRSILSSEIRNLDLTSVMLNKLNSSSDIAAFFRSAGMLKPANNRPAKCIEALLVLSLMDNKELAKRVVLEDINLFGASIDIVCRPDRILSRKHSLETLFVLSNEILNIKVTKEDLVHLNKVSVIGKLRNKYKELLPMYMAIKRIEIGGAK
jgi:hypothetical protein